MSRTPNSISVEPFSLPSRSFTGRFADISASFWIFTGSVYAAASIRFELTEPLPVVSGTRYASIVSPALTGLPSCSRTKRTFSSSPSQKRLRRSRSAPVSFVLKRAGFTVGMAGRFCTSSGTTSVEALPTGSFTVSVGL